MARHFEVQLDKIKRMVLGLVQLVEDNVSLAVQALRENNSQLALDVHVNDSRIDKMEVEITEECLHTLALYQPVAIDLRFIACALTVAKDLERIGDLSVNLGEQVGYMQGPGSEEVQNRLDAECREVLRLVRQALDAFVQSDCQLAYAVIAQDREIDRMHREAYAATKEVIKNAPDTTDSMIGALLASRHLERIADHAVNIAEDVVYLVNGEIVRRNQLR